MELFTNTLLLEKIGQLTLESISNLESSILTS